MVIWTLKVTMIFIIRGLKHPRCTSYISSREPVSSKREGLRLIPLCLFFHIIIYCHRVGKKDKEWKEGSSLTHRYSICD